MIWLGGEWDFKDNLSLKSIDKYNGNITFDVDNNFSQSAHIVYLVDEYKWENSGHHTLYKEKLIEKWYYIEAN